MHETAVAYTSHLVSMKLKKNTLIRHFFLFYNVLSFILFYRFRVITAASTLNNFNNSEWAKRLSNIQIKIMN